MRWWLVRRNARQLDRYTVAVVLVFGSVSVALEHLLLPPTSSARFEYLVDLLVTSAGLAGGVLFAYRYLRPAQLPDGVCLLVQPSRRRMYLTDGQRKVRFFEAGAVLGEFVHHDDAEQLVSIHRAPPQTPHRVRMHDDGVLRHYDMFCRPVGGGIYAYWREERTAAAANATVATVTNLLAGLSEGVDLDAAPFDAMLGPIRHLFGADAATLAERIHRPDGERIRLLGSTDVVGHPFRTLIESSPLVSEVHPFDRDGFDAHVVVMSSPSSFEGVEYGDGFRIWRKSQRDLLLAVGGRHGRAYPDELLVVWDILLGLFDVFIGERAKTHKMKESERSNRRRFLLSPVATAVCNLAGVVEDANPAFQRLLGSQLVMPETWERVCPVSLARLIGRDDAAVVPYTSVDGRSGSIRAAATHLGGGRFLVECQDVTAELVASSAQDQLARQLAALLESTRRAIDEQRQAIGTALHHDVLQRLAALRMAILMDIDPKDRAALNEQFDTIVSTIREAIRDLRPPQLSSDGLRGAVEKEIQTLRSFGISVQADLVDLETEDERVQGVLFRIIQEAITNIELHAQAVSCHITASRVGDVICVEIRDDGVGFDQDYPRPKNHYGLETMESSAALAGGYAEIRSHPGTGTTVLVSMPVVADRLVLVSESETA